MLGDLSGKDPRIPSRLAERTDHWSYPLKPTPDLLRVESLASRRGDPGVPNDLARLPGVRFVASTETEEGGRLDEAKIKMLTGGDKITARFLHKEWFDFWPTHKLWVQGNYKPVIRGTDNA